jgi:predicted ATPase
MKGRTIQEIRSDARRFQCEVLRRALASESALPKHEPVFLDRGIPDSLAYFKFYGISSTPCLMQIKYRKVFYLDPLDQYMKDYARIEILGERNKLAQLIWGAYRDLRFYLERVPALPKEDRVTYILGRVG